MDLIKTGLGIGKTIKNVGRLREIALIFAKHGLEEFLSFAVTSKIPNFVLPKSKREALDDEKPNFNKNLGRRLRNCFEELGPTFIKFGQLISTREDIFDNAFIEEMKILRDKVRPVDFIDDQATVEASWGCSLYDLVESIDENPIGVASIGSVYRARLISGEDVVLKIRRPNIQKHIETDFPILLYIVEQAEKVSSDLKSLALSRIIKDFSMTLQVELNFHREALNAQKLKTNLMKHDKEGIFYIPNVFDEYTTEEVLVTEYLDGIAFSDYEKIQPYEEELYEKMEKGVKLFIKTFLQDGFFHADLHGGNFFYLKNGKIGLVDFGLMGTLALRSRQNFLAIIYSLFTYNFENLVYEFLDVADYEDIPDTDLLISDVRDALSPFIGLTVAQTNVAQLLRSIIRVLNSHQIFLPREWFIVFRAFFTLDGVSKSLHMDFDLFSILEKDIHELFKKSVTKENMYEEMFWLGKDIMGSFRMIPRHLRWFLRDWSKKKYAFEILHTGHENSFERLSSSVIFLGFVLLSCVFVFAGLKFIGNTTVISFSTIPKISYIFWGISSLFFWKGLKELKNN
ncbi:MAG: ABC1 kinase family protein [Bacteriovoracaceae bacterium]